jgi:hypothetical protein
MYEGWDGDWQYGLQGMCSNSLLFLQLWFTCLILFFHYLFFLVVSIVVICGHACDKMAIVLKVGGNFTINAKEGNDEGAKF